LLLCEIVSAVAVPKNNELLASLPSLNAFALPTPSWRLTQLGVDGNYAIYIGGLANKGLFFGGSTTETVSASSGNGSWNEDGAYSTFGTHPLAVRGGSSHVGTGSGVFRFANSPGDENNAFSHRTILSGY
jgi:hypothetical protein